MSQLTEKRVALMISDPWEFGTECGTGPFNGTLIDTGTERIADVEVERALVKLDLPIKYSNASYILAICHVRHEGESLDDLEAGGLVSVNISLQTKNTSDINHDDFGNGFGATGSLQFV